MKYYKIQDVIQINKHGSLERESYFIEEMNKRKGLSSSGWKFYRIVDNSIFADSIILCSVTINPMFFYRNSLK